MPLLEGKVAVITGAGRGIGRAIAIQMAEEGARVVVNDPGVGPDGAGHDDGSADQVVAEIRATGLPAAVVMRQQRYGRIINFTSESGLWGNAGQANYGAAKSGIAGFTRVVARDMGRYGVTCNAIAPRAWTRLTATIPEQ